MEEDIKVIEELFGDIELTIGGHVDRLDKREKQALENLIKGYRRLELENQALENTQQNCPMMNTSGFQCEHKVEDITHIVNKTREDFVKQYIPKSKIKEKIEKYKKLSDEFYEKFLETNKTDIDIHDAGISCDAKAQVLQELLEEE